jgi:hypothetical protein
MKKFVIVSTFVSLVTACTSMPKQSTLVLSKVSNEAAPPEMKEELRVEPKSTNIECPTNMVLIEGEYCPNVEQKCLNWLPGTHPEIGPLRCAEFSPSVCKSAKRTHKKFCMDKFEWPGKAGELPPVDMTWYQAKDHCKSVGKRLCTDSEWTFACEGEDMKPYPYRDGYHRDESVCDQTHESMPNPDAPKSEWSKYYPGHASGSFPQCKSSFGVYDMVSGVDEWVVNESGRPYVSGLKGGYGTWKVRTRCRPMTDAHGPNFSFYNIGFRCCSDTEK